jgi:hypothetical protein
MSKARKRPFSHPLSGSNLTNILRLLYQSGPIPPKKWPQIIMALSSAILRSPFSAIENITTSRAIRHIKEIPPPVFIVGHWRSGTTHLCNILSKSPRFGYVSPLAVGLPWNMLIIGKIFRPLIEKTIPSNRLIDRVPVTPDAPQEDEFGIANMLPLSFLHALYFPKNFIKIAEQGLFFDDCPPELIEKWKKTMVYYLKKVSLHQHHKPLLVRNPVYTARLRILKELWPKAKFIHLYRNPYHIFHSMKNYYQQLLPALALQNYDHLDIEDFIFSTYTRMMQHLLEDTKRLTADEFIHVRYEDLEQNPLQEIEKIYHQLHLDGYAEAVPYFEQYLSTIQTYQKNTYQPHPEEIKKIYDHWSPFIQHWRYTP